MQLNFYWIYRQSLTSAMFGMVDHDIKYQQINTLDIIYHLQARQDGKW